MEQLEPLVYDLSIILGVAAIVSLIFQRIQQPVVLGYLLAGIIVGPYTPPYALIRDIPNIHILSELGVIFLMFSLGLEFSFQKLTRVGMAASVIGLTEVILMVLIGYATGRLLNWPHYDSLFLGAALSISSTTIIIKAIDELGLKTKAFAELVFGVLVLEDLLAILLLVILSTIVVSQEVLSFEIISAGAKLILVVGSWFLIGYFVVPTLFRYVANYITDETLTILSVALCLILVCIAAYYHYSTALGAFIMGSILAETILIERIEKLIHPIRDIFAAVFFVSVGMLINPKIIIQNWQVVFLLSAVTIVGKIITTSGAALLSGKRLRTSVRTGFSMAQIGEFSFIIAGLGLSLNIINQTLYPIIVAISGITTFTTPYLIRISGTMSEGINTFLSENTKEKLKNYSRWIKISRFSREARIFYRTIAMRLFLNGIIVAIIFTLIDQYLSPRLAYREVETWWSNTICLFAALIITSPFIWGMLFSFKKINVPQVADVSIPLTILIVWFVTILEIFFLGFAYFNWATFILLGLTIFFFILFFKNLEKYYHWLEDKLLGNIKRREE